MRDVLGVVPTVETLAAQALAAAVVVGSSLVAEYLKVRRRGEPTPSLPRPNR